MTPTVNQNNPQPTGNLPRNRMTYVALGAAVLVVLAVTFAPNPPRAAPTGKVPTALDAPPSKAEIDRYGKQLQAEEARLAAARMDANRAQASLQQAQPTPGGFNGQPAGYPMQPPAPEPKSTLEQERERREYASLFAPSVALSYRPAPAPQPPQTAPQPGTPATTAPPAVSAATAAPRAQTYVIFEGHVIEAALTNRLEGSFAGPVNCQTTTDVWSRDHQHLLIPQGSRIIGESKRVTEQDQERLAISFHRLIMPDGYSVNLDQYTGLDQAGATAVGDKVNHHYVSKFGMSVLLGVLSGFAVSGTGGAYSGSGVDMYRQGVAQQMSQSGNSILQRQLSRLPTITIREGQRVKAYVAKDLFLPDVKDHGKEVL